MSTYRFLEDAYINDQYYPAGTIAATIDAGGTLPIAWVPTGNVDPIDLQAFSDYLNVGPQDTGLVRTQFSALPVTFPGTYWMNGSPVSNLPQIAPPPNNFNQYYWTGAVDFKPGAYLQGASALVDSFSCGVLSFWINIGALSGTGTQYTFARLYQPGPTPPVSQVDPTSILTMNAFILVYSPFTVSNTGGLGLFLVDYATGNILTNCFIAVGFNKITGVGPVTGWHHCIWSWDSQQLITVGGSSAPFGAKTIRVQFAWDRGGTPLLTGGVFDSKVGCNGGPSGGSPQSMSIIQNDSFNGFTGQCLVAKDSTEWRIMSAPDAPISYAYCYGGFSDTFFDLTYPGNLDQFVTSALVPVDLGYAGANPTNQVNGHPLTCFFMHTGGVAVVDIDATTYLWSPDKVYANPTDQIATYGGLAYRSLQPSGPGTLFGPIRPLGNPGIWEPINNPFGQPQFQCNAADGNLWSIYGPPYGMVDSFTQPGQGI